MAKTALPYPVCVLAAGRSERMGVPKGLVRCAHHDGEPWLRVQLGQLAAAGLPGAVVVLGHEVERYLAEIPECASAWKGPTSFRGLELRCVWNQAPERGQFSSLQTGLAALVEDGAKAVFVLPVDTPSPSAGVWAALAEALRPETLAAVPVSDADGGHPVLLSADFIRRLCLLDASHRLDKELLKLPSRNVARVTVSDSRVRLNFNSPKEFAV